MQGPWYEETEMSRNDARNAQFEIFKNQYPHHQQLKKIINEIIHDKIPMCSFRGYWTFQHNEFKCKIKERFDYINKK